MSDKIKIKHKDDIHYTVFGEVVRPWGYEMRIAVFNDAGDHVDSYCVTWPNGVTPDVKMKDDKLKLKLKHYEDHKDDVEPEPTICETCGQVVL
jgi:hypothetical protein